MKITPKSLNPHLQHSQGTAVQYIFVKTKVTQQ